EATEAMSKAGIPLLAEVMVQYDTLNELYGRIANNKTVALYLRHTADRTQVVLNKYYSKTDDSVLYRLALLLHPLICVHYLRTAQWHPDWIATTVKLTEEYWAAHYKPVGAYNPLVWWQLQREAGNKNQGLTQMVLTFLRLSSSVDVERAFLFAGSIASKRRHNLAPYTIQATASLGSYSKARLVKSGILELPCTAKAKAKAKSRVAVLASNAADAV
ncbi:hypothetical protein BDV93DRAFT_455649, partial [Ceratobasidium sp. AG-I]